MTRMFPSREIARKLHGALSGDNAVLSSVITVPATEYGVVWKVWFSVDVASEADLENLVATMAVGVTIGSTSWSVNVHPYIAHQEGAGTEFRHVDLGPWSFDFGIDGFYSGVKGEDITFTALAAGTGIKTSVEALYSGD